MSDFLSDPSSTSILHVCECKGSGETARMRRLAWAITGHLHDKYHNLMSWLISCVQTGKALVRVRRYADLSESLLFTYVISTLFLWLRYICQIKKKKSTLLFNIYIFSSKSSVFSLNTIQQKMPRNVFFKAQNVGVMWKKPENLEKTRDFG